MPAKSLSFDAAHDSLSSDQRAVVARFLASAPSLVGPSPPVLLLTGLAGLCLLLSTNVR
jgi:hypothetical protein